MNDRERWRERVRDIRADARHDDDDDETIMWICGDKYNVSHASDFCVIIQLRKDNGVDI